MVLKEFGAYVCDRNPIGFEIERTSATGKYEIVAIDEARHKHNVMSAPTFELATEIVRFCQDICNDNVVPEVQHDAHYVNGAISSFWDSFVERCGKTASDRVSFENSQHEPQRAKNLVASLRDDPLIRFGSYSCTRRDLKGFELVENGAMWFLIAYDSKGAKHVCTTSGPDSEKELQKTMDEYIRLANQQYFDSELRVQWSHHQPRVAAVLAAPDAAPGPHALTEVPMTDDEKKAKADAEAQLNRKLKKKRVVKKRAKKPSNDDDDVDDKKEEEYEEYSDYEEDGFVDEIPSRYVEDVAAAKPAQTSTAESASTGPFVQKKPTNALAASRFLLGDGDDDDDDDDLTDDKSFVHMVDPTLAAKSEKKKEEDDKPHDGKLTLDKPTHDAHINAQDFALSTGIVLPNGSVEVVGIKTT